MQPQSQRTMSYSTLEQDYPRYPSISQCEPTDIEREMLMVRLYSVGTCLCNLRVNEN